MTKLTTFTYTCPNCGSKRVNKIDINNFFCMECDIEFDDSGNIYFIQYDGELLEYVPDDCEDESKLLEYKQNKEKRKNNNSRNSCEYLRQDFIRLFNEEGY
jgi:hypothetical protein